MQRIDEVLQRTRLGRSGACPGLVLRTLLSLLALSMLCGCEAERRKSDAELGLNARQVTGRRIYDAYCNRCHEPYSTGGKKGPGLKGVFRSKYLALSGLPANDERVGDIIRVGRHEMPGYSQVLSQQDLEDLLAYMHTL
jgi:mono/diheme cytochrome c family protein